MYIEISKNFLEGLDSKDCLWDVLNLAYCSAKNGSHIISCESRNVARTIAAKAKEKKKFDIQSWFLAIEESISEINGLRNHLKIILSITKNKKNKKGSGNVIEIGLNLSSKYEFWNKTNFVTENRHDSIFYKWISNYVQREFHPELTNILLTFDSRNGGGGSTTFNEYKAVSLEHPTCCILDSDQKYPTDSYGETAQYFIDHIEEVKSLIAEYCVLEVHELENLFFSESFSDGIIPKTGTLLDFQTKTQELSRLCESWRLFFDVKKGCYKKNFEQFRGNPPQLRETYHCKSKKILCNLECDSCKESYIGGFSSGYMDEMEKKYTDSTEVLKYDLFKQSADNLPESMRKIWTEIFEFLFPWICGLKFDTKQI